VEAALLAAFAAFATRAAKVRMDFHMAISVRSGRLSLEGLTKKNMT
jgi:hypothetical protein